MPINLRERQVHAAARRIGLKLIIDCCKADQMGRERDYLRPIWDARYVVRVLPSGGYEMAMSRRGKKTCRDPTIARRHRTSNRRVERTSRRGTAIVWWMSEARWSARRSARPTERVSWWWGKCGRAVAVLPRGL